MPRTPEELAAEARASLDAGARGLHLHPHDADGRQIAARCVQAMVEPLGEDPAGALTEAGAIENVLADVLAYRPALHL